MAPGAIQEPAAATAEVVDIKTKMFDTTPASIETALADAQTRFEERNPVSKRQHELATQSLPGGNTRTLLYTSPFPLVMKCGRGVFVWSEDGHK
jgi:glutamate-1-semialdehyde 2,1-aminomutase